MILISIPIPNQEIRLHELKYYTLPLKIINTPDLFVVFCVVFVCYEQAINSSVC